MKKYVVLDKKVGQTPLECAEKWRAAHPEFLGVPLAYAGRLDPMASGKLLVLIGEECKRQSEYHSLDKEYEFEILFGMSSDSGDVLGLVSENGQKIIDESKLRKTLKGLVGPISLPYPKFSSKTVQGKPLHTWTLEGRLGEIKIPAYEATIYSLSLLDFRTVTRDDIYQTVSEKIETIPPVTDARKALGNDFRRPEVRKSWSDFVTNGNKKDQFAIAKIRCVGSSGLYMRTLSEVVAKQLDTAGLAYSIHRSKIGKYFKLPISGVWLKLYN